MAGEATRPAEVEDDVAIDGSNSRGIGSARSGVSCSRSRRRALGGVAGATVAALATLLAIAAPADAARRDRALESFAARSDYGYELAAPGAQVVEVALDAGGFEWPAGLAGDTVFLELEIERARRSGPLVRARRGEIRIAQAVEAGARGRRFLDLSPLIAAAGARVVLEGEGVRWANGSARLFGYSNPHRALDGVRVLVVAPHPDDAEIAAFGVYSWSDADVVTVTSGDEGEQSFGALYPEPGEHYRMKGWIRTWDSLTVPLLGGVPAGRARNLGFYDATLRGLWRVRPEAVSPSKAVLDDPGFYRSLNLDPTLRARPFVATWPGLVGDLVAELERVKPQVVVAPHPLLDRHRDHQFAAAALFEALASWGGDCELWLYTNHAIENESWPLGPRTAMTGLPPWSGGELYWSSLVSFPLDDATRRRKQIALEAMHDLRPFDTRPHDLPGRAMASGRRKRDVGRYDYFRRAPRPNELFFVLTPDDAARLLAAFLERETAAAEEAARKAAAEAAAKAAGGG